MRDYRKVDMVILKNILLFFRIRSILRTFGSIRIPITPPYFWRKNKSLELI
tara:strand:+ start:8825 stop:8977 length:153 start_codon:yes stop_codon:yes gene_type:complete